MANLTKHYGEVVAVAGIDLEVQAGEFFTMLGPSGSGKTTTLRMIAGFEDPSGGTVELAGHDVSGVPPYDRAVNTVFQDYALFPHMTVGENVAYGLRVAGVGKEERARRRDEALEMVRLPGYGDRKPGELSGGQRQRVALARAIVNRPKVLLLDEPLGALDLKLREQMQVELKTIQSEVGITFVYVTHDQDEALTMSDRIAVFNEGLIEQVSSPVELYEKPTTEFVAGFVGVSNLLERDGSRFTIRPEKIQLLENGAARRRPAHRAGQDRRRRLRGHGDPLHRRPRRGRRASTDSPEHGEHGSGCRLRAGVGRLLWAGARSTRSPSEETRPMRRDHREEPLTPGTDGLARHRRPARIHARCWPAAAPATTEAAAAKNCRRSARERAR